MRHEPRQGALGQRALVGVFDARQQIRHLFRVLQVPQQRVVRSRMLEPPQGQIEACERVAQSLRLRRAAWGPVERRAGQKGDHPDGAAHARRPVVPVHVAAVACQQQVRHRQAAVGTHQMQLRPRLEVRHRRILGGMRGFQDIGAAIVQAQVKILVALAAEQFRLGAQPEDVPGNRAGIVDGQFRGFGRKERLFGRRTIRQ
ncbi:hypothetical protein G6F68_015315 [Rhizopus microsporus]|nr:hypothetical protein G6F68_015315 [Rhizopus microsporus]